MQPLHRSLPRDSRARAALAACCLPFLLGPLTGTACGQTLAPSIPYDGGVVKPNTPAGPLPRLMPLGDSLTEGVGAFAGYRKPLWQRLVLAGTPWNFVGSTTINSSFGGMDPQHEGHGGYRVSDLIGSGLTPSLPNQLDGWLQAADPEVVLLHAGTNDIFLPFDWQDGLGDIEDLLDIVWAADPSTYVIVAEILPTVLPSVNLQIESFNRALREIVRARLALGFPVGWVDMYNGVENFTSLDNVHPELPVYEDMADVWFEAIEAIGEAVVLPPSLGDPLAIRRASSSPIEPGYPPLFAIDGSSFENLYQLALAEGAPGADLPASWRSVPFNVLWLTGGPVPDPVVAPMFEIELDQPAHVRAVHLWNGRGIEFDDPQVGLDLRMYDTMTRIAIETADAAGVWTDRGEFDLRQQPRVRKAPGELLEVDWADVLKLRFTPLGLVSATIAPDNPPGTARVSIAELLVYGTPAPAGATLALRRGDRVGVDAGPAAGGHTFLLRAAPPGLAGGPATVLTQGRLDAAGRAHWAADGLDRELAGLFAQVPLEFLIGDGERWMRVPVQDQ